MENSVSEQSEKAIDGWRRTLSGYLSLVLMLITAFIAVIAISEIAARESVLSMLTGRITALKSEFVEQNRNGVVTNISSEPSKQDSVPSSELHRERLLSEIEKYEDLKRFSNTLIAMGSEYAGISLRNIQYQIIGIPPSTLRDLRESKSSSSSSSVFLLTLEDYVSLSLLSSDRLLAITMMACAAIGAMIAALRGNSLMTFRALSLGIATGFVVYLAIKGGKHVFMLQMQGEIVAFNPYGCAFAGLLAGLFTEKAYQILTTLVDDFADRLRAASIGKKNGD